MLVQNLLTALRTSQDPALYLDQEVLQRIMQMRDLKSANKLCKIISMRNLRWMKFSWNL